MYTYHSLAAKLRHAYAHHFHAAKLTYTNATSPTSRKMANQKRQNKMASVCPLATEGFHRRLPSFAAQLIYKFVLRSLMSGFPKSCESRAARGITEWRISWRNLGKKTMILLIRTFLKRWTESWILELSIILLLANK